MFCRLKRKKKVLCQKSAKNSLDETIGCVKRKKTKGEERRIKYFVQILPFLPMRHKSLI